MCCFRTADDEEGYDGILNKRCGKAIRCFKETANEDIIEYSEDTQGDSESEEVRVHQSVASVAE